MGFRGHGDRSEKELDCWCPILGVWAESTALLSILLRQMGVLRQEQFCDPGEMCPWICMVAQVMSDVWHPAQDSNKQPTGRASKAHLSIISLSHHSHPLHSSSHTSPTLFPCCLPSAHLLPRTPPHASFYCLPSPSSLQPSSPPPHLALSSCSVSQLNE